MNLVNQMICLTLIFLSLYLLTFSFLQGENFVLFCFAILMGFLDCFITVVKFGNIFCFYLIKNASYEKILDIPY